MLDIDANLAAAMTGTHSAEWIADVDYAGVITAAGLPLTPSGSIRFDRGANIQASGRLYVTSDVRDGRGRTLAPQALTDTLAPFGQELELRRRISLGSDVMGVIPLGRFRIKEVPESVQTARRLGSSYYHEAVALELVVTDRFEAIEAHDFIGTEAPAASSSTWAEIRRLSPFPIVVNPLVSDASIPASLAYTGNRLDALQLLASNLEGQLAFTRQGSLTVRPLDPFAAGVDVVELVGTVQTLRSGMSNELRNVVVLTGKDEDDSTPIVVVERILEGPLRWDGPMGARVKRVNDPLATTPARAQASARTWLKKVSDGQAKLVRCVCLPNPALDLGDPVHAVDPDSGEEVTGIVDAMSFSMNPSALMDVDILIPREVIPWV